MNNKSRPLNEISALFSRVPPQSLRSEQAVLGGILYDNKKICEVLEIIQPEDFYREGHRAIYRALLDLFNRDVPIDTITLTEELRRSDKLEKCGGPAYISRLPDLISSPEHVPAYAKTVHDKSILRNLIATSQEVTSRAYEDPPDVDCCN